MRVEAPVSITGEEEVLLDGSALSSDNRGIYATETFALTNLGTFTTDEVGFIQDADALQGGFQHFSGGAVVIEQYAVGLQDVLISVADTVFANNGGDMHQQVDGGGFVYRERTQSFATTPLDNRLEIQRSAFYNNKVEGYAGGLLVDRANEVFIEGSTFQNNSATAYGGAALFVRTKDIVIEDTSFFGNTAQKGGAIYVSYDAPEPIGANLNSPFSGDKGPTLTIRAVNRDVVFRDNQATDGEGSDIFISKIDSQTPYLNLSAREGRKIELNGEVFLENTTEQKATRPHDPGNQIYINSGQDDAGEIVLNGILRSRWFSYDNWDEIKVEEEGLAYVNLQGGTLTLGNPLALSESRLIVDGDRSVTLNLTSMLPGATDPISNYEIGYLDAPNHTIDLIVDVDLERGVADTLSFGNFRGYRNYLRVSGWNVVSDVPAGTEEIVVTLAGDENVEYQRVYYELTEDAQKAVGALYVYDVSIANPDEWEADPMSTDGKFLFTVAGAAPEDPPARPDDFNPQVYGGTLAQKAAALLQHEISHRLFDTGASVGGHASGSIEGGTMDVQVSHFDDLDFDYWVALMEAQSSPVALGENASGIFGIYGGFVSASMEGRVNDISSLGAYLGVKADLTVGPVFWKNHANVGYLESDLDVSGGRDGGKTENVWLGVGSSLGFVWNLRDMGLTISPSLDAVYTFVKGDDFTTGEGVDIEVGDYQGWELSPGVRLEHTFTQDGSWRFYTEARYVWTGDSADVKAVHLRDQNGAVPDRDLPGLRYGDFAEALIGVQAERDDWTFTLGFDGKFGETHGWGAGAGIRWQF